MASEALDADLQRLADAAAATGAPPLNRITVAEARERVRAGNQLCKSGPDLALVADRTVEHDGRSVGVRIYRPTGEPSARTLVYVHGGSWLSGDLDYADEICRFLARDLGCTLVSVDYRLAPEHPHPEPLHDVYAALRWTAERVDGAGVLGIMGDSAGGNLAAATTIVARDAGPCVDLQVLVYPVLDHDLQRPSYRVEHWPIARDDMIYGWDQYAPDPATRDDPTVSPVRLSDHGGLPPAHVVVAGHDPLHDEGVEYAQMLEKAGVPVSITEHPNLAHGFLRFTGASAAAVEARGRLLADVELLFRAVEQGHSRKHSRMTSNHDYH